MAQTRPRLCVITGAPGAGKTNAADDLQAYLPAGWRVLHGDDYIGITQACYPSPEWEPIRRFLPFFAGWAAGGHLFGGRSVLLEAHLRDDVEVARVYRGARDIAGREVTQEVVKLEADPEILATRMTADPRREPGWNGPGREENFRKWSQIARLDPALKAIAIDVGPLDRKGIARKVAGVFGVPSP